MKKLSVLLIAMVGCLSLSACEGTEFDPSAIENMTRTVDEVTSTLDDMQTYIGEIQESVQAGIDNTNAIMEWYKTEAWEDNPWISTPITEDQVEDLIEVGQKEINSYLGENAVYDILSNEDIEYFNKLFNDEEVNGFLLSTYEKPESCDVYEVLKRDGNIIRKLGVEEREKKGAENIAGKISEKDINELLTEYLGITNDDLISPVALSERSGSDKKYLYLDEKLKCRELVCNGGFYYNNIYVVMMRDAKGDTPFSLTALTKQDDGSIKISMNYWSDDMSAVEWDGSFLYDLYDMMQYTDLRNVISIPGIDGDISLGSVMSDLSAFGISGENIADAAQLVSKAKDKTKTYMQEFDGYQVYFSNIDPSSAADFVISQIDVTSGDFKTAEGIGLGSTIEDIKEAYGNGIDAGYIEGKKQVIYEKGKYSMLFLLNKAGEVEEMSMVLADDILNGDDIE